MTAMDTATDASEGVVLYDAADGIATITMNRPRYHNAQNSKMTYALDAAFRRAVDDDAIKVIILAGNGKHFSAGHDIGTPQRDAHESVKREHLLPDHEIGRASGREGGGKYGRI